MYVQHVHVSGAMVLLLRHQISLGTNTLYVNKMSPFSRYQVSNLATEKNTPRSLHVFKLAEMYK